MKKVLLFVALTNILILNSLSAQKTWVGGTSISWATGTSINNNWNTVGAPTPSQSVTVGSGSPHNCNISTAVSRSGTTTITFSLGISGASGVLTNTGAITVLSDKTLTLANGGTLTNNSGGTISFDGISGTLLSQSGATINNNTGASMTFTNEAYLEMQSGTFYNSGGTLNFNSGSQLWLNGGTFNNTGTINNSNSIVCGQGTISGNLFTNPSGSTIGESTFAGFTCLTFSNGLTNNGTMLFQVNGATACSQRDNIVVTGAMTFGGTFTAKGTATSGTHTLMTYGSKTGAFTNSSAPLGNGYYLHLSYGPTSLTGTVTSSPLAAELVEFDANTEGSKNHLTWRTASELNNSHFDIERSTDGKTFHNIGQVKGNNKPSSYQFVDNQPFATSYYRLRQIDFDGTETVSKVVSVELKGKGKGLKVYPTLVSNGILTVALAMNEATEGGQLRDFSVMNLLGQQVLVGKTTTQIDVSALAKGTYMLKVGSEVAKFVKQ
jgi:hypothetical protein